MSAAAVHSFVVSEAGSVVSEQATLLLALLLLAAVSQASELQMGWGAWSLAAPLAMLSLLVQTLSLAPPLEFQRYSYPPTLVSLPLLVVQ